MHPLGFRTRARSIVVAFFIALAALLAVLQVSSFWYTEIVAVQVPFIDGPRMLTGIVIERGTLIVASAPGDKTLILEHRRTLGRGSIDRFLGFGIARSSGLTAVGVPCLLISLGCALVAWRLHRKRRLPEGVCEVCGYDLRASPVRCPECGTTVAVAAPSRPAAMG